MRRKKLNTFHLKCQLEDDKICDNCCDCFVCELDPGKICDNCAKCLSLPDFNSIIIDVFSSWRNSWKKKSKEELGIYLARMPDAGIY